MRDEIDYGVPVDLTWDYTHRCKGRWRHGGNRAAWQARYIAVGTLADGRWYVDSVGQVHPGCRAYRTRASAWAVAQNLMAAGGAQPEEWERVPCYPTDVANREQEARRAADGIS